MAIKYRDEDGNLIIEGVEISHPNVVNDNFRFYVNAAEKINTLLEPAPVPVLLYHQDHVDPIGEVKDAKFTDSEYVEGAKAISATLVIKDEEAAKKFEKGLYKRFSIGTKPKKVVCSICGKERGECEHIVGKIYDGKLCYDKVFVDRFLEVSVVNIAADKFAVLHEKDDLKDALFDEINLELDTEEDMADKDKTIDTDFVEYAESILGEDLSEEELNDLETIIAGLDECDECGDEDVEDSETEDRKLPPAGSKARKKMKTTFCGPNKTFPVPDCKHGAVALAMLNWPRVKAKYKGQISKIRACIMRVGRKLGCAYAKKKKDELQAALDDLKQIVDSMNQAPASLDIDFTPINERFDRIEETLAELVALMKDLIKGITDKMTVPVPVKEYAAGGKLLDEIKASLSEAVKENTDKILEFLSKATSETDDTKTDDEVPNKVLDGSVFGKIKS